MRIAFVFAPCLLAGVVAGCSSTPTTPDPAAAADGGASCAVAWECTPGGEIGTGDGSAASVALTEVHVLAKTPSGGEPHPVDLAFNPKDPGEVWIVCYGDDSVHVGYVDGDAPQFKRYRDPAATHFMHKPPAIAMGDNGFWGTCGNNDNRQADRNSDGTGNNFMGPALFTTDRSVFAKPVTRLGSHYDMLHNTPFCRGIAHVEQNWYWVFNAYDQSLDKYNFAKDHGPGEDDHSDGEIYRYAAGQVKGADDETPSHLVYDPTDKHLYVADSGNQRIVKLDTTKGTEGEELRVNEPLAKSAMMDGTSVEVVVDKGVLEKPSGIELKGDLLYVTDAATSTFHVFKKDGTEVRKLATGLPPGTLAGFAFGFDKKIWFTDRAGGRLMRIDPK